jgi:hypothetical protein
VVKSWLSLFEQPVGALKWISAMVMLQSELVKAQMGHSGITKRHQYIGQWRPVPLGHWRRPVGAWIDSLVARGGVTMDDLFLLSESQMRRIKPCFPLSHEIAWVDDGQRDHLRH